MNLHTNLDLTQKKVAETAEIPKTAPKPNPKAEKNPEKVAETVEIHKTAPQPSP